MPHRVRLLGALFLTMLFLVPAAGAATLGPRNWLQLGSDAQHPSGYGPWTYGSGLNVWSANAAGGIVGIALADGRVFASTSNDTVEAWNATTGAFLWSASTPGTPTAPQVAYGKVYVGTSSSKVLLLDAATGNLTASATIFPHAPVAGLAIAPELATCGPGKGVFYATQTNDVVTVFYMNSSVQTGTTDAEWPASTVPTVVPDPAAACGVRVFAGSGTYVDELLPWNPHVINATHLPASVGGAPVAVSPSNEGTVHVTLSSGVVMEANVFYDTTGWSASLPHPNGTVGPLTEASGTILGVNDGTLFAMNASTGTLLGTENLAGPTSPGVAVDGLVYVATSGLLEGFVPDSPLYTYYYGYLPTGTPTTPIVADGLVFVGVGNQMVADDAGAVPYLLGHAPVVAEATGPSGAVVSFTDPSLQSTPLSDTTTSCGPASGSTFALGSTTVTCTATNVYGLQNRTTFTVTVQDMTPPTIHAANVTVGATNATGTDVNFTVTATDLVDGTDPVSCSPASGSFFPYGTTTVSCSSTDAHHNTLIKRFTVTVGDVAPPVLSARGNVTVEATSASGTVVAFHVPTATDNLEGVVPVSCSPASGHRFPLGDTTVRCSAKDSAGNVGRTSFTVSVVDTVPPVVAPHPDVTASLQAPSGSPVTFTAPAATDDIGGAVPVTCSPASGSTFPLGTSPVTCTAQDDSGNVGTSQFLVTVRDPTPPTIASHADLTAYTIGNGVGVAYEPPAATDDIYGPGTAVCRPGEGFAFPVGTTTVTCSYANPAGLQAVPTSFSVTVIAVQANASASSGGDTLRFQGPHGPLSGVSIHATVTNEATGATTTVTGTTDASGAVHLDLPAGFQQAGDYGVTYTATDQGTTWSGTSAYRVAGSSGSSGVPGPGAASFALAFTAAALMLRRRRGR